MRMVYLAFKSEGLAKSQRRDLFIQYSVVCRWILRDILYIKSPCVCFCESLNYKPLTFFYQALL